MLHSERTQEPPQHILNRALAEYLQISHHTLYQISTATALVEGIYEGAVRVGMLRQHGDFGLGTFENLDGEMVALDGRFFQVRGDGSVNECKDAVLSPFAVMTHFVGNAAATLLSCDDLGALISRFDKLRRSDNLFFSLRVDGQFDHVRTRAMRKAQEGVPLVEAAKIQPEFEFVNLRGTLVGFWTPDYARTLNVPGYHFHFISDDRKHGGHLLECSGQNLSLKIQDEDNLRIALPETTDFLKANLRRDPAEALAKAEKGKS